MKSSFDEFTSGELGIEVSDLVVHRGRTEVLHGISCSLDRGSITGLLGPSGCGKTTFMRSLLGVQRITSGTARVLGLPVGDPRLRHRMAYTSQAVSIYTDATVLANVRCFAGLLGADEASALTAIHRVRLDDLASRRVDRLSGGQASRASLACALVGDPEVLVLDEPTVGLDPLTREALWRLFRELAEDGVTLLISSHVMDEASRCDSVLFMREGRILTHEPVTTLQERTGTPSPEAAFLTLIKEQA
ncbi:ABC transporter ATP-binding protein [Arachnia propionica]|uniref:ABC transporter ATP-binding protein n=2 Tax=Arachnia propionica TaxID=1750 RepID=A0A3P1T2C8_9ACTN|nr:ABC transporter ATP-binding protein [Arachnia propionica]